MLCMYIHSFRFNVGGKGGTNYIEICSPFLSIPLITHCTVHVVYFFRSCGVVVVVVVVDSGAVDRRMKGAAERHVTLRCVIFSKIFRRDSERVRVHPQSTIFGGVLYDLSLTATYLNYLNILDIMVSIRSSSIVYTRGHIKGRYMGR